MTIEETPPFTFREHSPGIFLVEASSQYHLTSTFVRLQEFYESPFEEIRGNYFTHAEFMDRYAASMPHGRFSYFEEWSGFNIPGHVVRKFFDEFVHMGELSPKEQRLLDHLRQHRPKPAEGKFYLIGVEKGNEALYFNHEIAHALFYLDDEYKKHMTALADEAFMMQHPAAFAMWNRLVELGYANEMIVDEIQAYAATSDKRYFEGHFPDSKELNRKPFAKHFKAALTARNEPVSEKAST